MTAPPPDLEQAADIASVGAAIEYDRLTDCTAVSACSGRLSDGTSVRLFALSNTEDDPLRERFEQCCAEWEQYGTRAGLTAVHARGKQPVPWIAVEQADTDTFAERAPSLAAVDRRNVLAALAETLWQLPRPHLVCHPERVWVSSGERGVHLDWAIDRLCLGPEGCAEGCADAYVAPEVRENPAAGDQRSDVYTLGALASYARTGTRPKLEPSDRGLGLQKKTDRTSQWLEQRAMNPDPQQRFESCYAFKRAALFGTDESAGREEESDSRPARPIPTGMGEDRQSPTADQRVADSAQESEGVAVEQNGSQNRTLPATIDDLSRRQILGATAVGTALIGTATGVAYWQRDDPDADLVSAAEPEVALTAAFDGGIIELTNTGTVPLDPEQVRLRGEGFTQPPTEMLAEVLQDSQEFESGDRAMLGADPAYELRIEHLRNDESKTLVESEGPEAADHEPERDSLYTPDLPFGFETQNDSLRVRYGSTVEIRGDHIRVTGSDFGGESGETWNERLGGAGTERVAPGDSVRYELNPAVVLRVEWAPPYLDDSTTVAQYEGPARPRNSGLGGVSGPRYDINNTGASMTTGQVIQDQRWSADLDGTPRGSFAVDAGRLFTTGGSYLYAFDAADGEELWRRYVGAYVGFSPVVSRETVFITKWDDEGRSTLYALDASDGSTVWTFDADSQGLWPPTVTESVVFTGGAGLGSGIFVLDREDGSRQMTFEDTAQIAQSAVDLNSLYVRSSEEDILELTANGISWTYPADGFTPPTATSETVFGVDENTGGAALVALDPADGSELWRFETTDRLGRPQAVADNMVFAGGNEGVLYAVGADSGEKRWMTEVDGPISQPPVVGGSQVYIASQNQLQSFATADGEQQWTTDFDRRVTTEPAVVDGSVYVGTATEQIFALNAAPF